MGHAVAANLALAEQQNSPATELSAWRAEQTFPVLLAEPAGGCR
jgi:hypothetical protein